MTTWLWFNENCSLPTKHQCISGTYSRMNTFETYSRKDERILIVNRNNNQPNIIQNEDNTLNFIDFSLNKLFIESKSKIIIMCSWLKILKIHTIWDIPYILLVKMKKSVQSVHFGHPGAVAHFEIWLFQMWWPYKSISA